MENNEIIQTEPEDWDFEDDICQKCGQKCSCDVCKCTKKKKCATVFTNSIGNPMHSAGL